jgi:hypothetical protein
MVRGKVLAQEMAPERVQVSARAKVKEKVRVQAKGQVLARAMQWG